MAFASPRSRSSSNMSSIMHGSSGSVHGATSSSSSLIKKSPTKLKKLQSAYHDHTLGTWICRRCGYSYPNKNPDHHQRRAHKKLCDEAVKVRNWLGDIPVSSESIAEGTGEFEDAAKAAVASGSLDGAAKVAVESIAAVEHPAGKDGDDGAKRGDATKAAVEFIAAVEHPPGRKDSDDGAKRGDAAKAAVESSGLEGAANAAVESTAAVEHPSGKKDGDDGAKRGDAAKAAGESTAAAEHPAGKKDSDGGAKRGDAAVASTAAAEHPAGKKDGDGGAKRGGAAKAAAASAAEHPAGKKDGDGGAKRGDAAKAAVASTAAAEHPAGKKDGDGSAKRGDAAKAAVASTAAAEHPAGKKGGDGGDKRGDAAKAAVASTAAAEHPAGKDGDGGAKRGDAAKAAGESTAAAEHPAGKKDSDGGAKRGDAAVASTAAAEHPAGKKGGDGGDKRGDAAKAAVASTAAAEHPAGKKDGDGGAKRGDAAKAAGESTAAAEHPAGKKDSDGGAKQGDAAKAAVASTAAAEHPAGKKDGDGGAKRGGAAKAAAASAAEHPAGKKDGDGGAKRGDAAKAAVASTAAAEHPAGKKDVDGGAKRGDAAKAAVESTAAAEHPAGKKGGDDGAKKGDAAKAAVASTAAAEHTPGKKGGDGGAKKGDAAKAAVESTAAAEHPAGKKGGDDGAKRGVPAGHEGDAPSKRDEFSETGDTEGRDLVRGDSKTASDAKGSGSVGAKDAIDPEAIEGKEFEAREGPSSDEVQKESKIQEVEDGKPEGYGEQTASEHHGVPTKEDKDLPERELEPPGVDLANLQSLQGKEESESAPPHEARQDNSTDPSGVESTSDVAPAEDSGEKNLQSVDSSAHKLEEAKEAGSGSIEERGFDMKEPEDKKEAGSMEERGIDTNEPQSSADQDEVNNANDGEGGPTVGGQNEESGPKDVTAFQKEPEVAELEAAGDDSSKEKTQVMEEGERTPTADDKVEEEKTQVTDEADEQDPILEAAGDDSSKEKTQVKEEGEPTHTADDKVKEAGEGSELNLAPADDKALQEKAEVPQEAEGAEKSLTADQSAQKETAEVGEGFDEGEQSLPAPKEDTEEVKEIDETEPIRTADDGGLKEEQEGIEEDAGTEPTPTEGNLEGKDLLKDSEPREGAEDRSNEEHQSPPTAEGGIGDKPPREVPRPGQPDHPKQSGAEKGDPLGEETKKKDAPGSDPKGIAQTSRGVVIPRLSSADTNWEGWDDVVRGLDAPIEEKRPPPLLKKGDDRGPPSSGDQQPSQGQSDYPENAPPAQGSGSAREVTPEQVDKHQTSFQPEVQSVPHEVSDNADSGLGRQQAESPSSASAGDHIGPVENWEDKELEGPEHDKPELTDKSEAEEGKHVDLVPSTTTLTSPGESGQTTELPTKRSLAETNWEDWEDVISRGPTLLKGVIPTSANRTDDAESSSSYDQTSEALLDHPEKSGQAQGKADADLEPQGLTEEMIEHQTAAVDKDLKTAEETIRAFSFSAPRVEVPQIQEVEAGIDEEYGKDAPQTSTVTSETGPGQTSRDLLKLSSAERNWDFWDSVVRESGNLSGQEKTGPVSERGLGGGGEHETAIVDIVQYDSTVGGEPGEALSATRVIIGLRNATDPGEKQAEGLNPEKQRPKATATSVPEEDAVPVVPLDLQVGGRRLPVKVEVVDSGSDQEERNGVHNAGVSVSARGMDGTSGSLPAFSQSKLDSGPSFTAGKPVPYPVIRQDGSSNGLEEGKIPTMLKGHYQHEHVHGQYDLAKVLRDQTTYDLICPICGSLITRKVILRKAKRHFVAERDARMRKSMTEIVPVVVTDDDDKQSDTSSDLVPRDVNWKDGGCVGCLSYFFKG